MRRATPLSLFSGGYTIATFIKCHAPVRKTPSAVLQFIEPRHREPERFRLRENTLQPLRLHVDVLCVGRYVVRCDAYHLVTLGGAAQTCAYLVDIGMIRLSDDDRVDPETVRYVGCGKEHRVIPGKRPAFRLLFALRIVRRRALHAAPHPPETLFAEKRVRLVAPAAVRISETRALYAVAFGELGLRRYLLGVIALRPEFSDRIVGVDVPEPVKPDRMAVGGEKPERADVRVRKAAGNEKCRVSAVFGENGARRLPTAVVAVVEGKEKNAAVVDVGRRAAAQQRRGKRT